MSYSKNLLGGTNNYSDGYTSTISGGELNTVSSTKTYQAIGGGWHNSTSENFSTIIGGQYNTSDGYCSMIGGGLYNNSDGYISFVGGGSRNTILANPPYSSYQFIGGGYSNSNKADYGSICGGAGNILLGGQFAETICGGLGNSIANNADRSAVGGGLSNTATGSSTTVAGGGFNNCGGYFSSGGGGTNNGTGNTYTRWCGGDHNSVSGAVAVVGGGTYNFTQGDYSTVVGGFANNNTSLGLSVCGAGSFIGGGQSNNATGFCSFISDGYYNLASGAYSGADGYQALANKVGQYSHSSSSFRTNIAGGSQFSRVVFNCTSINGASANLNSISATEYTLTASTSYLIRLSLVASQANGVGLAMFIRNISVSVNNSSVGTIINETAVYTQNTPGYGGITTSIVGTTLRIAFSGISGQTVRAVGTMEATELTY